MTQSVELASQCACGKQCDTEFRLAAAQRLGLVEGLIGQRLLDHTDLDPTQTLISHGCILTPDQIAEKISEVAAVMLTEMLKQGAQNY